MATLFWNSLPCCHRCILLCFFLWRNSLSQSESQTVFLLFLPLLFNRPTSCNACCPLYFLFFLSWGKFHSLSLFSCTDEEKENSERNLFPALKYNWKDWSLKTYKTAKLFSSHCVSEDSIKRCFSTSFLLSFLKIIKSLKISNLDQAIFS